MDTLLQLVQISKRFPGVQALSGIDFSVERGEIHALLGENGAGKSTLMKILCGVYVPDEGQILLDGAPRKFRSYHEAVAAGIGIVFQEFSLIPYLTAVENIFLGRELRNSFGLLRRSEMRRQAAEIIGRLNVSIDLNAQVHDLSVAQQQFVEIAKALSLNAKILILDEPTATLTPSEAAHLFNIMRDLKRQGVGLIFISHHLEEIFDVCDKITVLRDGQYIGTKDAAATDIDSLVEMMVGHRIEQNFPPKPEVGFSPEIVLDVEELQLEKNGPVNTFNLRVGEILGFAGLVGSGRTETALGVLGAMRTQRKKVKLNGREVTIRDPADALALGLGILPENRKAEGLITAFSVKHNMSINNLAKYRGFAGLLDFRRESRSTGEMIRKVGVKTPSMDTTCDSLSGGNQQKVVIARWLNHSAKVLFFDEPTRGIDVGAKAEIYILMRELTAQGYSIVMVSSELPEIVGMCDRVAVFKQGRIVQTLEHGQITPTEVMRYAAAG